MENNISITKEIEDCESVIYKNSKLLRNIIFLNENLDKDSIISIADNIKNAAERLIRTSNKLSY